MHAIGKKQNKTILKCVSKVEFFNLVILEFKRLQIIRILNIFKLTLLLKA